MPSFGPKWRALRGSPSNSRRLIPTGARDPTHSAWSGASVRYVTLSCSNPSALLNCRQRPFSSRLTPPAVLTHTRPRLSTRIAKMTLEFSPGSWMHSNRHPPPLRLPRYRPAPVPTQIRPSASVARLYTHSVGSPDLAP